METAALAPSKLICRVCQKQFANYTCPRCNLRYCSLPCYKGHSVRCTESFNRDNVESEMKSVVVTDDSKRKMLEMLKRFHSDEGNTDNAVDQMDVSDDDDDEAATGVSDETLQKIIDGGEIRLEDLSENERKSFQRSVASGELARMIKPWEPWWCEAAAKSISLTKQGTRKVQPTSASSSSAAAAAAAEAAAEAMKRHCEIGIPLPPTTPIPPLSSLSKVTPSPLLAVHLVDIIYSYCFVLRIYNGDWKSQSFEATNDMVATSNTLTGRRTVQSVGEAIAACTEVVCSPYMKHLGGLQLALTVCDDTCKVLEIGKAAVICALADLERIFQDAKDSSSSSSSSSSQKATKAALMKTKFFMSWANEQCEDIFSSFAALVDAEKHKLCEVVNSTTTTATTTTTTTSTAAKKTPVIEEL